MATTFLHGTETIFVKSASASITTVRTAVIGLVGIAPKGAANIPIVVNNEEDAAQFGSQVPGFSIPQSLDAIIKQGAGGIVVVNVFDATKHTVAVTGETKTVTAGKLKLAYAPIGTVTITDSNDAAVTYVRDTDYTIDDYGNFQVISSAIANNIVLKFGYKRLNESLVLPADIVGTIDPATDLRTGTKCFELCYNLFGYNPKIFIAPTFSQLNAISTELIVLADKYRGFTYIDAPTGTTKANAIAGRGPLGSINFNTSNERTELLYPHLVKYDLASDSNINFPYSAYMAGVRAATDNSDGYWVSSSNREIKGIVGSEVMLSAAVNDPNSDTNQLNAAGITTVFNTFGTGIRTWGNRNASFPTSTGIRSFSTTRRVSDIVAESIELASLANVDAPITTAWIDDVVESVNSFIRELIRRGAIIDGKCWFDKILNPASELQKGNVRFDYDMCPTVPGERMSFYQNINIDYLSKLKQ